MKLLYLSFCLSLISTISISQETKRIHKKKDFINEIYYVFKDNKSVKHGKYVKYEERSDRKLPIEYGCYNNNKKTGTWLFFNDLNSLNPVRITGDYSNGEKNGQWTYFYAPVKSGLAPYQNDFNRKLSEIKTPKGESNDFKLTVDTSGIRIACVGSFSNNKKVGKWSYYSTNGQLIKEYDFSSNKKVIFSSYNENNLSEGLRYFKDLLFQTITEKVMTRNIYDPLTYKFEIITSENNLIINNLSNNKTDPVWKLIERYVSIMNRDWIDYDEVLENYSITIDLRLQLDKIEQSFQFEPRKPIPLTFQSLLEQWSDK